MEWAGSLRSRSISAAQAPGVTSSMDHLVRPLSQTAVVLDLGAGPGSFSYAGTAARVLALDVDFSGAAQRAWARVLGDSGAIPLGEETVDVVVCNHTLEHFPDCRQAIREIDRVLRPGGSLWVAVPDGWCLDDRLYRFLFRGGGHVNRFSLASLVEAIETGTRLRTSTCKKLYTGFVYLNPPEPQKLRHYPRPARLLVQIPPRLLRALLNWMNYTVRLLDRFLRTRLSQYGWALVVRREDDSLRPVTNLSRLRVEAGDANVCFACGAGHVEETLKPFRALFRTCYKCPNCGTRNFISPLSEFSGSV